MGKACIRLLVAFELMAFLATSGILLVSKVNDLSFHIEEVSGTSMYPTITEGDHIFTDRSRRKHLLTRSDIVELRWPANPSVSYVKRVIGLPGDEVTMRDGRVWVNGSELKEPYVCPDVRTTVSVRVQPGHYFVLGDNRPDSWDSRELGSVPEECIRGRVVFRVWPRSRLGRIN